MRFRSVLALVLIIGSALGACTPDTRSREIRSLYTNPDQRFIFESASFFLPPELDKFRVIEVDKPPCEATSEFEPKIPVITFELVGADADFNWESSLPAPFLIKVYYDENELKENGIDPLNPILGICYTDEWVLKRQSDLVSAADGIGWFWIIQITSAKDPMVAWGP